MNSRLWFTAVAGTSIFLKRYELLSIPGDQLDSVCRLGQTTGTRTGSHPDGQDQGRRPAGRQVAQATALAAR